MHYYSMMLATAVQTAAVVTLAKKKQEIIIIARKYYLLQFQIHLMHLKLFMHRIQVHVGRLWCIQSRQGICREYQ